MGSNSKWKELCRLCLINVLASRASWSLVTEGVGPSPRSVHSGAFDGQRLWVHAGAGEQVLKDLWVFDVTINAWTSITQVWDESPSERKDHVAVWDPVGEALWIHGGYDGTNFLKDVWKFSDSRWMMVAGSTVAGPCPRSEHVAVWDSTHSVLWIHGGYDGSLKSDLWKYDSNWLLISQKDADMPSGRAQHVAAWDDAHLAIWLHGGYDELGLCKDLWRYDTIRSTWKLITVGGPTARAYHVAAWDPTNLALWIHGGFDGMACEDLWRFDTSTSTWFLLYQGGPSARFNHVAAWDVTSMSFWVHGGYVENGPLRQDLWRFHVTTTSTSKTTSITTSTGSTTSSKTSSVTTTRSSTHSSTATTTTTQSTSSRNSTTTESSTSLTVSTTTSSTSSRSTSSSSSSSTATLSSTQSTTSTQTSTYTSTSSTSLTVSTTTSSTSSRSTSSSSSSSTVTSSTTRSTTSSQTSTDTSTSSTSQTVSTTTTSTFSTSTSSSSFSSTATSSTTRSTTSSHTSTDTSTSSTSLTISTTTTSTSSKSTSSSSSSSTTRSTTSSQTSTDTFTSSTSLTVSTTHSSTSSRSKTGTATSSTSRSVTRTQTSTETSTSITQTTSSRSTSSRTFTTVTTSTSTNTYTLAATHDDRIALSILCPLAGALTLVLVVLISCWARKQFRFRLLVMPAAVPPPPPPPAPPLPPPDLPVGVRCWECFNMQLLQPLSPIARVPHCLPLILLNLPDLTQCAPCFGDLRPRPMKELHLPEVPKHVCINIDFPIQPSTSFSKSLPSLDPHPQRHATTPTQTTPALETPATVRATSQTWLPGSGVVRRAVSFRAAVSHKRDERRSVFVSEPRFKATKQVQTGYILGKNLPVKPSPPLNTKSLPMAKAPSIQREAATCEQEKLQCKCFLQRRQPAPTRSLTIYSLPTRTMLTKASRTVERQLPLSKFLPEAAVNNEYSVPHNSLPRLELDRAHRSGMRFADLADPDVGKRLIQWASILTGNCASFAISSSCLIQRPVEPEWPQSKRPRLPGAMQAPPVPQTPAENWGLRGVARAPPSKSCSSRSQRLQRLQPDADPPRNTSSRRKTFGTSSGRTTPRQRAFYLPPETGE